MPLYEYHCKDCGPFTAIRKMSECANPVACAECGASSDRVISAPHFALLGKLQRQAHETNERSAHEPKSVRRSSCGCNGTHTCKPNNEQAKAAKKADQGQTNGYQMQTKKTARPWMLGH